MTYNVFGGTLNPLYYYYDCSKLHLLSIKLYFTHFHVIVGFPIVGNSTAYMPITFAMLKKKLKVKANILIQIIPKT